MSGQPVSGVRRRINASVAAVGAGVRCVAGVAAHFLEHVVAIVLGVALFVVGLGLSVTIVFIPAGLAAMLLGVALVVGGP
jgi:hypothetical protein